MCKLGVHLVMLCEDTLVKIVVSALERQLSWGDTDGEVVDRKFNLAYVS